MAYSHFVVLFNIKFVVYLFIPSFLSLVSFLCALQDVSAESSLKWPELYRSGQKQELSSPLVLLSSFLHAIYASLVYFFIPYGVFHDSALAYQTMAVAVSLSALFTATTEVSSAAYRHFLCCTSGQWRHFTDVHSHSASTFVVLLFALVRNTTGLFEVIAALLLVIVPFLCKSYRALHQYTADRITRRLILID